MAVIDGDSPRLARLHRVALLVLVTVTAIYGSMFGLSKTLLERLPVTDYLGQRYLIAGVTLALIAPRRLRGLSARTVACGVGLGLLYGAAQYLQFRGLAQSAPTVAAFVIAMFVVFTPLLAALLPGGSISMSTVAAVLLATAGVATMSLRGWSFGQGELLTLIAAALYSVHLLVLGRFCRPDEAFAITFIQVVTMGILFTSVASLHGLTIPQPSDLIPVLYLGIVVGALAMFVLTWAVGHVHPGEAAVLLVLEPVWAAIFGALVWHEHLGERTLMGAALVLAAMLMVVLRPANGGPIVLTTGAEAEGLDGRLLTPE